MRYLLCLGLSSLLAVTSVHTFANVDFLTPEQAFSFSAESINNNTVQLQWKIAPHYYLYHDQFKVSLQQKPLKLNLPASVDKDDPNFGLTRVHYNHVQTQISVQPNSQYLVTWQGCSSDGLCYPLQRRNISTDAEGLLGLNNNKSQKTLLNNSQSQNVTLENKSEGIKQTVESTATITPNKDIAPLTKPVTETINSLKEPEQVESGIVAIEKKTESKPEFIHASDIASTPNQTTQVQNQLSPDSDQHIESSILQLNNDQGFLHLLSPDHLTLNLLIFFLLGILLAFLPCSLPLIPILSGIIIQEARGYRAIIIALSFVLSMAMVYALMGVLVAEIGYSFQRWFQNPIIIGVFSLIFIALALNLFGLYQLTLPRPLLEKLDQLQSKQQGGTLVGAVIMGILSALIVGPCMSAPLAGALLFVSQSHDPILGSIYMFILGLGIGVPLFIASVFGAKYLPKPGLWMDRIKIGFGFIMLMVALYFIRPMLGSMYYSVAFALLCLSLAIYLFKIRVSAQTNFAKTFILCISLLSIAAAIYNVKSSLQNYQIAHSSQKLLSWQHVTTSEQFEQALQIAKQQGKPILIDVYADWCTACQPIENEVLPRTDVQQAMANFTLIKLDLTNNDPSQASILKQREILGPPTLLFLDNQAQELRQLRLTGTFSAKKFIHQLEQVK
ncbi:protein-disulfide reductase DsbD [Acinetobacter rudis]|nr:protein-disulfide reductase DsbD [Acinetobacter rudis]MDQ8953435.1 protein-disulfide reductase DsbD [Acinetobacter rudis]